MLNSLVLQLLRPCRVLPPFCSRLLATLFISIHGASHLGRSVQLVFRFTATLSVESARHCDVGERIIFSPYGRNFSTYLQSTPGIGFRNRSLSQRAPGLAMLTCSARVDNYWLQELQWHHYSVVHVLGRQHLSFVHDFIHANYIWH